MCRFRRFNGAYIEKVIFEILKQLLVNVVVVPKLKVLHFWELVVRRERLWI